jgi:hypothetical protein
MRVTDKPSAFTANAVGAYADTPEATNVGFDFLWDSQLWFGAGESMALRRRRHLIPKCPLSAHFGFHSVASVDRSP